MEHKKQIRYEFFKVVSKHKEKTFWGPGSYGGAIDYIIHSNVEETELHLDMVYMRPEDARKEKERLEHEMANKSKYDAQPAKDI